MKQLLVLTDFSERSNKSIKTAFRMAKQYGAKLNIYHHLTEGELISLDLSSSKKAEFLDDESPRKSELIRQWNVLSNQFQVDCQFILSADNFITKVQDIVRRTASDLIIMAGTPENERLDSKWYTNTQAVVNHVDCPVLVLKSELLEPRFKNIVFASSFNQKDQEIFQYFLQLFDINEQTTIHLLAIDTSSQFSQPRLIMEEAMLDFEKLVPTVNIKRHFYADFTVDMGIRNFIQELQPDLLVMGNKFNKPIKHFLLGNSTLQALAKIDTPILTIDFKDFPKLKTA